MIERNLQMKPELNLGWGQADITPQLPVLIAGLFHARISEGVANPLTVTACAMESGDEQAVFVSCDLIQISDELREACLARLHGKSAGLDPSKVILNATHTHTAPVIGVNVRDKAYVSGGSSGLDLEVMPVESYIAFAAERIVMAIVQAWNTREPGGVAFGQGMALIGRNRRWVDNNCQAIMYTTDAQDQQRKNANGQNESINVYNLDAAIRETFRHIEGYDDHNVQIVAAYDVHSKLTGLIVNVPCPSQESEEDFVISADWWHETRQELRRRFGETLFVLPQCSAAGDLSPHLLLGQKAHDRMLALKGRTAREEIAYRIADAVEEILPYIGKAIDWSPKLAHQVKTVALLANTLTKADLQAAEREAELWQLKMEQERQKLEEQPALRQTKRWYIDVTYANGRMHAFKGVIDRFKQQQVSPTLPVEMHVVRLGEIVFATQPFECYLDFGMQIQLRSPATQTFLVQLAGKGTYLPSPRSVRGGGYGSTATSNPVGPEGGQQLVEETLLEIHSLWEEKE